MIMKRNRVIAPRSKTTYSNAAASNVGFGSMPGDLMFNTGLCKLRVFYPNSKHRTYFRPFAALDPTDPQNKLLPGREEMERHGQSVWIIRLSVIKYVGVGDYRINYVMNHPEHPDDRLSDPYKILYDACKAAKERGKVGSGRNWRVEWNGLLTGSDSGGACIGAPTTTYVTQGLVYSHDEDVYVARDGRTQPLGGEEGDPLPVITMTVGAGLSLLDLLDTPSKKTEMDEKVLDNNFKYGSAVGRYDAATETLPGGLIIGMFRTPRKMERSQVPPFWVSKEGSKAVTSYNFDAKRDRNAILGYDVSLHKELSINKKLCKASLDKEQTDANFSLWQFWFPEPGKDNGLVRFLSMEEKVVHLARALADVSGVLKFGWYSNPEFFTEDVQAILKKRKTFTSPMDDDDDDSDDDTNASSRKKSSKAPMIGGIEFDEDGEEVTEDDEVGDDADEVDGGEEVDDDDQPADAEDENDEDDEEFDEDGEAEFDAGEEPSDDDSDDADSADEDLDDDEDEAEEKEDEAEEEEEDEAEEEEDEAEEEEDEAEEEEEDEAEEEEVKPVKPAAGKSASKKAAAKEAEKPAGKKPAAKEAEKPVGKKTAVKEAEKPAGKKPAAKEAEKPAGKKPSGVVTIGELKREQAEKMEQAKKAAEAAAAAKKRSGNRGGEEPPKSKGGSGSRRK